MKAEHRKELQTNLLYDRMGRLVQTVKGRPSRRGVLFALLGILIVIALVVFGLMWRGAYSANAERWQQLDLMADEASLAEMDKDYPETPQGKTARMQFAWMYLWEKGVKIIGRQPVAAFQYINAAKTIYNKLKEDCKDDPILCAEAYYGFAVAEESLACNTENDAKEQLDRALDAYKETAEKFPRSAHGLLAEKRAGELEKKERREQIDLFYNAARYDVSNFMLQHKMFSQKK